MTGKPETTNFHIQQITNSEGTMQKTQSWIKEEEEKTVFQKYEKIDLIENFLQVCVKDVHLQSSF